MRIVLDTNILVRANPKTSPAGLARDLLLKVLSPPSPADLVRTDPGRGWPLTDKAIGTYLALLEAASFMVELPREIPAIVTDPDDDPILQTAIVGQADVSVLATRPSGLRGWDKSASAMAFGWLMTSR